MTANVKTSVKKRPNSAKTLTSPEHADSYVYLIENTLYINLTDRCSLACGFCPKHNGCTTVKGHELFLSKRPLADQVIPLIGNPKDYDEVVFCGYGEPTLRINVLLEIARWVKAKGGNTRINTDGLGCLFHKRDIVPELATCIDALSVSLNAHNESVYQLHCQPSLPNSFSAVQAFIRNASQKIPRVYVSAINGLEGVDIHECKKIAEKNGGIFRQRELDVVG